LNYAYAILESEVWIKTIGNGYDPTIGIVHDGRDGSSKFVFDLKEPERPKVDRLVLDFVKARWLTRRISRSDRMVWCDSIRSWRGIQRVSRCGLSESVSAITAKTLQAPSLDIQKKN
jgi:CRISPR/Cas system-associated endonuclease Cas1